MLQDLSPTETHRLIEYFVEKLYEASIQKYRDASHAIAVKNQQIKQADTYSFMFMGKRFYAQPTERFLKPLDASLVEEMRSIELDYRRVVQEEGGYARNVFIAACSLASVVQHLYQLLPEQLHELLHSVQIKREFPEGVSPLSDSDVLAFKTKHAVSLGMINQRLTRNMLGII